MTNNATTSVDEQPIRVLAVDDDPMVLDLIRVLLGASPDIRLVATASDGDEVVEAVIKHRPDVVLMDVRMQRVNGIDACAALSRRPEAPRVVMLTTFDDSDYVPRAMEAGAVGFILKVSAKDELYLAVRQAHAGHSPMSAASAGHLRTGYLGASSPTQQEARRRLATLTERERNVAELVAQELTNTEIAKATLQSEGTVKQTLATIQSKLAVSGKVGIAAMVARGE